MNIQNMSSFAGKTLGVWSVVLGLFLAADNVDAGVMLDQSFNAVIADGSGGPLIASFQSSAQTFTAGLDGILTQVDLQIYTALGAFAPDANLTLSISPGLPGGPGARSIEVDRTLVPSLANVTDGFVSVDVSSLAVPVTSGEIYTLELSYSGRGNYIWQRDFSFPREIYSRGAQFSQISPTQWRENLFSDVGFQTFVGPQQGNVVPELSTFVAMSLLFVLGLVMHERRRQNLTRLSCLAA